MNSKSPFKWRNSPPDIILLGVRWYTFRKGQVMKVEKGDVKAHAEFVSQIFGVVA